MSIPPSSGSQYDQIKTALETGQKLAYDKQENRFTVLSTDDASVSKERYITDLHALKDKVANFVKEHGISDTQELTRAFEKAEQKLKETPVTKQQRLQEALGAEATTGAAHSTEINQLIEYFDTERKFYQQVSELNTLMHDVDFNRILKQTKVAGKTIKETALASMQNLGRILNVTENFLLGLYEVNKLAQENKYDEALQLYSQLVQEQYGEYAAAMTEATKMYSLYPDHTEIFKAAFAEYAKQYPEKANRLLPRDTIPNKASNLVQRAPRHKLFAETIVKKRADLAEPLQVITEANLKLNENNTQFVELREKDRILTNLVTHLKDDPKWEKSLRDNGLDLESLVSISGWYDRFGVIMADLELPIEALKEEPNNLALQKEVHELLTKLKKELTQSNIDPNALSGDDLGLVRLDLAIANYRKSIPSDSESPQDNVHRQSVSSNYGALFSERIYTVANWLRTYT